MFDRKKIELSDKAIWLIGASSGIGLDIASELAERGNFLIVSARNREPLSKLALKFKQKIKVLDCDITDSEAIKRAALEVAKSTDHLDCVINCAGICEYQDSLNLDPDMYRRTFDVNFFANLDLFNATSELLRKSSGTGVFCAVGSLVTQLPFPRAEAYGSSKAALEYWVKSMQSDLNQASLRMCLLRPGFVDTPLTRKNDFDMPFLMSSQDAAKAALKGIESGKLVCDFPKRFSGILKTMSLFEGFWFKKLAPKMSRIGAQ